MAPVTRVGALARFVLLAEVMRELLFVVVAGATACAARSPRTTLPVQYACGNATVVVDGGTLRGADRSPLDATRQGWSDDAGDHFVTWPLAPTDADAVELVVPADRRQDATARYYDTKMGSGVGDWRLVRRETCTARGGYNDALARYLRGESLDELARDLSLADRHAAREIVHHAMLALQKRYYREH